MTDTKKQKTGIARLLEIAGKRKGLMVLSATLAVIHAALALVPYILVYYILKQLIQTGASSVPVDWLVWAFAAVAASVVLLYASGMASHVSAFNILYEIRTKIADKLGKLPLGYVSSGSSGAFKKILADDVERIELFIAHGIPDIVKALALPLFTLGFLFTIDWRLTLVSLIPLLMIFVASYFAFATDKSKSRMQKYHKSLEDMNSGIVEFVRAMPVMKIFGQSASEFKKYSDTVNKYEYFIGEWIKGSASAWGMLMSFVNNALLPLLAVGLLFFFNGSLSLSVFFLFLILGVGYVRTIFAFVTIGPQITMINHGVKRIDEILFDVEEQTSGETFLKDDFSVRFKDVSFSYKEGIEVLKKINFAVPQGSITALVGPSGSGKSTIGQLTARFYDANSGSVLIGNTDIKNINHENLMDNVGFVFQDSMMFYQTIFDNISMGASASKEKVIEAAKIAHCHDFIMELPNGYETKFGDKGVHLSGGEQQRIQLARVVLKDPKILILDEATAFSDPENEHLIMKAFSKMIQNKTVIVIAHRLSTIADADQIVVTDKGEIKAKGTHSELLAKSELYKKMWDAHKRAGEFEININ